MTEETTKWLMTPVGPLSYPKLFRAVLGRNPLPGSQPRRSTDILFTAADLETPEFRTIAKACLDCAQGEWGSQAGARIKAGQLKLPFKRIKADSEYSPVILALSTRAPDRAYPPQYVLFMTASAVDNPNYPPPQIISASGQVITDERLIYPGVMARLMVNPYPRRIETNKGVSLGLGNVQMVGKGERLAGGVAIDPKTQFPLSAADAEDDPLAAFAGGNSEMFDGIPS